MFPPRIYYWSVILQLNFSGNYGTKNDKIYYINQIPSSFKPYPTSYEEYTRTFLFSWIKKFNVKVFICLTAINSYYTRDLLFVGSLQWLAGPIVMRMNWYAEWKTLVCSFEITQIQEEVSYTYSDGLITEWISSSQKPMLFFTWGEGFKVKSCFIDFDKRYT